MEAAAPVSTKSVRGRVVAARLPFWVLLGALAGVLAGLTFGDRMATLQPIGVVYAMLLESVVYPYILSSLIVGLGSLASSRTRELLRASWMIGGASEMRIRTLPGLTERRSWRSAATSF